MIPANSQVRIVRSAEAYVAQHGEPPSVRELADAVNLAPSTVAYHLGRLRQQGKVVDTRGRPSARCPHCGH